MPTPKTEFRWAVYDPQGRLLDATIRAKRDDAIDMAILQSLYFGPDWPEFKAAGFRCVRVRIEEVVK